ncbi:hypothetical protein [Kitasatospora sp. NBC_01302]|uniref:hypothetical protein n=1 Tax=Kitasatospora sp. NBC_01302 TaxID=2903575 RepID=UPI002E0F861F|nr:hypothetical protein OG294_39880 [Kitasatospora sp. NBC_01302]
MHDPAKAADAADGPAASDGPSGISFESAHDVLQQVLALYNEQIHAERRRPAPDTQRLGQLLAERKAARAEQLGLADADERELARIQTFYDARLSELTGP